MHNKIVVLDTEPLDMGDLDWSGLKELGDVTLYPATKATDIVARAKDADIVLTNKCVLDETIFKALPKLKYIGELATGYNQIDIVAARERGIPVTNVPAYGTDAVGETVVAYLLHFAKNVSGHDASVHNGDWVNSPRFSYMKTPIYELAGKTLGIIGFGTIGRRTAELALAFKMHVLAYSPSIKPKIDDARFDFAELDDLLKRSDFVSLHCPLNASSKEFMNKETLALMKPSATLINTGRGALINEQDLADALNFGVIARAALDVLTVEPPMANNPLLTAKNCLITPHTAWIAAEARERLLATVTSNLRAYLSGSPVNVIN